MLESPGTEAINKSRSYSSLMRGIKNKLLTFKSIDYKPITNRSKNRVDKYNLSKSIAKYSYNKNQSSVIKNKKLINDDVTDFWEEDNDFIYSDNKNSLKFNNQLIENISTKEITQLSRIKRITNPKTIYERSVNDIISKQKKLFSFKKLINEKEIQECTFKPTTNKESSFNSMILNNNLNYYQEVPMSKKYYDNTELENDYINLKNERETVFKLMNALSSSNLNNNDHIKKFVNYEEINTMSSHNNNFNTNNISGERNKDRANNNIREVKDLANIESNRNNEYKNYSTFNHNNLNQNFDSNKEVNKLQRYNDLGKSIIPHNVNNIKNINKNSFSNLNKYYQTESSNKLIKNKSTSNFYSKNKNLSKKEYNTSNNSGSLNNTIVKVNISGSYNKKANNNNHNIKDYNKRNFSNIDLKKFSNTHNNSNNKNHNNIDNMLRHQNQGNNNNPGITSSLKDSSKLNNNSNINSNNNINNNITNKSNSLRTNSSNNINMKIPAKITNTYHRFLKRQEIWSIYVREKKQVENKINKYFLNKKEESFTYKPKINDLAYFHKGLINGPAVNSKNNSSMKKNNSYSNIFNLRKESFNEEKNNTTQGFFSRLSKGERRMSNKNKSHIKNRYLNFSKNFKFS